MLEAAGGATLHTRRLRAAPSGGSVRPSAIENRPRSIATASSSSSFHRHEPRSALMTTSRTWSVVSKPVAVRLRGVSGLAFQPTWVQSGDGPDCPDGAGFARHGCPDVVLPGPLVEFTFPRTTGGDMQVLFAGADWSRKHGAGSNVEGHEGAAVFDYRGRMRPDATWPHLSKYYMITKGPAWWARLLDVNVCPLLSVFRNCLNLSVQTPNCLLITFS